MTTGSIQAASITLSKHKETYLLFLTLTNNSGAALVDGQMVYADGNLTVDVIVDSTDDAEFPIGIVDVGGADQAFVTIATALQRTLKVHNADGGTIAAGDFVKANGVVNANGKPEWIPAVADDFGPTAEVLGDWAHGIVLSGALTAAEALVGVLRTPVRPTPVVD